MAYSFSVRRNERRKSVQRVRTVQWKSLPMEIRSGESVVLLFISINTCCLRKNGGLAIFSQEKWSAVCLDSLPFSRCHSHILTTSLLHIFLGSHEDNKSVSPKIWNGSKSSINYTQYKTTQSPKPKFTSYSIFIQ